MLTERTFDTGKVTINYAESASSGPLLVLLHGIGSRWQVFLNTIPSLAVRWRVVAVDLRGHGRSGRVTDGYGLMQYAGDVGALLRHLSDEPAVLVRDLTGRLTAWIEVGAPDAERLHRGSKQAQRCAVYTHRDPAPLLEQLAGQKIHRAAEIPVYSFERAFMDEASAALGRRASLALSVTGRHVYLDIDGRHFESAIGEARLAPSA